MSDNEESIYIPLSDLLTGFIFVFLLLLLIFMQNQGKDDENKTSSRSSTTQGQAYPDTKTLTVTVTTTNHVTLHVTTTLTSASFLNQEIKPQSTATKQRRSEKNQRTLVEILEKMKANLSNQGIRVLIDAENGIIRLPAEILFKPLQYTLDEKGVSNLRIIAKELNQIMLCYTASRDPCTNDDKGKIETILIEGHTDWDPIKFPKDTSGTMIRDNWDLSVFRATTTYRLLLAENEAISKYRNSYNQQVIGVSGYGHTRLVDLIDKSVNRRIDIRIIMETEPIN